ncbi:MAG: hypothetical protein IT288_17065 [Bdellovibrionales bacterium]|nr:hypothetical protein [Bdellovibrionales bacterium]
MTDLKCNLWKTLCCHAPEKNGCMRGRRDSAMDKGTSIGPKSILVCPLLDSPKVGGNASPASKSIFEGKLIDPIRVLAGVAAAPVSMDDFQGGLDWCLCFLLEAFGADDGELFLFEPQGNELLVLGCVGVDREALLQKERFKPGEGYPGIAYFERRPVASKNINCDRSFLRKAAVSSTNIRTFISVPISGPSGDPIGSFDLAWHRDDLILENTCQILMLVARALGTLVGSVVMGFQNQKIGRKPISIDPIRNELDVVLRTLVHGSRADCGRLIGWDSRTGDMLGGASIGEAMPSCPSLVKAERDGVVPACPNRSGRMFGQNTKGHKACKQMQFDGSTAYCIPFESSGILKGIAVLGFHRQHTIRSVQSLIPLQSIANEASLRLHTSAIWKPVNQEQGVRLEIRCFGHFEVKIDGLALLASVFTRRRALTLLKILALRAGRPIHRDLLIDWLWSDEERESVRLNRLYGLIHSLRQVVETSTGRRNCVYILGEGESYRLDLRPDVFVDCIRFRELINLAEKARLRGDLRTESIKSLSDAIELYEGDLFEDDPYAEWCQAERADFQRDFVSVLVTLAHLHSDAGELGRSIGYIERALKIDPFREDLQRSMVEMLTKLGRTKEARERCIKSFQMLKDEIGVEPSLEFRQIHRALGSEVNSR